MAICLSVLGVKGYSTIAVVSVPAAGWAPSGTLLSKGMRGSVRRRAARNFPPQVSYLTNEQPR